MTRLGGDHYTRAARSYDVAEQFKQKCCSVEVHFQDRLYGRLRRRYTSRLDQSGDLTKLLGGLNQGFHGLPRRDVNRGRRHVKARVGQSLCRRISVLLAKVSDNQLL